jgi:1,4-dihydroxy-2-naphthoate octaprenyltransferase
MVMERSLDWTTREIWVRQLLYPAHTLPTAAAPALVAGALALHDGVFNAPALIAAFLAGWLVQLGGVIVDNYVNLARQPDDREHPELARAVRSGRLSLASLAGASAACYAIALLAGIYLVALAGPGVVVIGLASFAASWAYSAGPYPIGKAGFADPLFFVFFGIVSVAGCYYVQAAPHLASSSSALFVPGAFPLSAIALGIPVGALTTNILVIDDIRDRTFDRVKGKRTIAVRFGAPWSRRELTALLLVAYAALFWLAWGIGLGTPVLLPLATLPYAAWVARNVHKLDRYEDLIPVTPEAGRLLLAFSTLLAAGIVWSASTGS